MQFRPYSFSRLSSFDSCPLKFKFTYIDKLSGVSTNDTLDKGSYLHNFLEHYPSKPSSTYNISEENLIAYNKIAMDFIQSPLGDSIVNSPCTIGKELDFGLDNRMNHCNFNSPDALLRGSIDRLNFITDNNYGDMLHIIDYKSGKLKEERWQSFKQVMLYTIWIFRNPAFNAVDKIKASYVYIEHAQSNDLIMERKYLNTYIKEYIENIKDIETALEFPKKVSKLCDYCDYFKEGLCDGISKSDN
jgi:ATP-dependent helicase/DNAse subunit B